MKKRVVITGIGSVTTVGSGKKKLMDSLFLKHPNIQPIPARYEANYQFKSRFYSPLPEINLSDYEISSYYEGSMQEEDKMAVISAKLALEDAGFHLTASGNVFSCEGLSKAGIILGSGFSSLDRAFKSYLAHVVRDSGSLAEELKTSIHYNRMIIPQTMPNSISAWISILFQMHAFHYTVNAACASGTAAIGEAYRKIKDGDSDLMLSGGVECLKDEFGSVMRGFDTLGALTRSEEGLPMPFSQSRTGFLFSEGGGCLLVLEELGHALKRNASIYAEIEGYSANSDAYHIVQMDPSGDQIALLLETLKKGHEIDYLNSHGTGTGPNDEIESAAIQKVFGGQTEQPVINSTKGVLGHTIGASGAIEAAVTAMSIKESQVHGNLTDTPMAGLNLPAETLSYPVNYAITVSYGFGGHNAGLLLRRFE